MSVCGAPRQCSAHAQRYPSSFIISSHISGQSPSCERRCWGLSPLWEKASSLRNLCTEIRGGWDSTPPPQVGTETLCRSRGAPAQTGTAGPSAMPAAPLKSMPESVSFLQSSFGLARRGHLPSPVPLGTSLASSATQSLQTIRQSFPQDPEPGRIKPAPA